MCQLTIERRLIPHVVAAIQAVVKQGGYSMADEVSCAYRSKDGKACVVGQMIPDEWYTPSMEFAPCNRPETLEILAQSLGFKLTANEVALLQAVQQSHDSIAGAHKKFQDFIPNMKAEMAGQSKWHAGNDEYQLLCRIVIDELEKLQE